MKLNDLKLLVDCSCNTNRPGVVRVGSGFSAAKNRLVRRGLIEEDPYWLGCVRITNAGDLLVEKILSDHP